LQFTSLTPQFIAAGFAVTGIQLTVDAVEARLQAGAVFFLTLLGALLITGGALGGGEVGLAGYCDRVHPCRMTDFSNTGI
jgi:hypothetical protein